jgi:sugar phosphate isomerase/epimerase
VALGAFTVPGDGSLDFGAIVQRFADYGYEGWFVVEAEQDPRKSPPQKMAEIGHAELMRVMTAAGYTVETEGFPKIAFEHHWKAFPRGNPLRRKAPHHLACERAPTTTVDVG